PQTEALDASLSSAVTRCLARDPDARFGDAEALLASLDQKTSVARSSLPPALRAWVSEHVPLAPFYAWVSVTGLLQLEQALGFVRYGGLGRRCGSTWASVSHWQSCPRSLSPRSRFGGRGASCCRGIDPLTSGSRSVHGVRSVQRRSRRRRERWDHGSVD